MTEQRFDIAFSATEIMREAAGPTTASKTESKAITNGCIEAFYVKHLLEHQTARTFKIEAWTVPRHHTTSSTRAQSKALGGADDVGSTVEQARLHLDEQIEYA